MKKLPLGHAPISSYLSHAYPLSILAQENRYLPWFYNSHIQLFSFPGEELKFYTSPLFNATRNPPPRTTKPAPCSTCNRSTATH